MDPDEAAYRRSVRNTLKVLGVVVVVLAAALIVSAYFDVPSSTFQTRTTIPSTYPFVLGLSVNSTHATAAGGIAISIWINGTGTANVTASNLWPVNHSSLWMPACQPSWPVGIGLMQGHFTADNISAGSFLTLQLRGSCPAPVLISWFYFNSQTSRVLVSAGGNPEFLTISSTLSFSPSLVGLQSLSPGVYTAVAADEWGDLVMTSFRAS